MRIIRRAAALGVIGVMPGVALALADATLTLWRGMTGAWFIDDAVTLGAAAIGTAVATYLSLTGYAMLVGAIARGGRGVPSAVARWAPGSWRRLAAFALGVGMTSGLAGPAFAADAGAGSAGLPGPVVGAAPAAVAVVESGTTAGPGWLGVTSLVGAEASDSASLVAAGWVAAPGVPSTTAAGDLAAAPAPPAPAEQAPSTSYVVTEGDSLWLIAESLLGPQATSGDIAAAWPQLYEANKSAIGADPSLIQPGLELTIPGVLTS